MEKRGAIELPFNWILIIAVGAVLILMFMSFISKQQHIYDFSGDILKANSISTILSSHYRTDASTVIGMQKSRISFNCDSFTVNGISQKLSSIILFSPSFLETDKLNLLSFGWDMPYRISGFIYASSPEIRHIFIGNSDFAAKAFEKVRGKLRADGFTSIQAIENEGDASVRIIFFGQIPSFPESLRGMDENYVTALRVDGNFDRGHVEFFDFIDGKIVSRGVSGYMGEAMLFGAVFSDELERYNCEIEKAFTGLSAISQIYMGKSGKILAHYDIVEEDNTCRNFYQSNMQSLLDSISILSSQDPMSKDFGKIADAANEIEKINNIADSLSCILTY